MDLKNTVKESGFYCVYFGSWWHIGTCCILCSVSIDCFQGDDSKGSIKSIVADTSGTEPDEILREFGIPPVSGIIHLPHED